MMPSGFELAHRITASFCRLPVFQVINFPGRIRGYVKTRRAGTAAEAGIFCVWRVLVFMRACAGVYSNIRDVSALLAQKPSINWGPIIVQGVQWLECLLCSSMLCLGNLCKPIRKDCGRREKCRQRDGMLCYAVIYTDSGCILQGTSVKYGAMYGNLGHLYVQDAEAYIMVSDTITSKW